MLKRMLIIGLILLTPAILSAQTYINERFGTFPPTGWTIDTNAANWHTGVSNNAGGTAPEAVFDWSPQFSGTSRFISPYYNLTGVTSLKLQFRQFVDHYATPYTLGVATRDGHGAWHVAWSVSPSANIGPQILNRDITTVDVGADSFQICWYFTGSSYNIDYWYIDNILMYSPVAHDAKVTSINIDPQYTVGDPLFVEATVENIGLNAETFSVNAKVLLNQTVLYDNTQTGISLAAGASTNVEFPDFAIPTTNEIYDVIICTQLAGDLNTTNDTLVTAFNTYDTPRDMVVLEIGTGTWCQYCPGAAMGADDLVENGHNVAVVEYHGGSTTEPFKNTDSEARIVYYGISGYPTAFFDGTLSFVGGSNTQSLYSYYLPLYNQRHIIKSAFSIDMAATHTGNNYQLQVTVIKRASIRYQNIVLHTALTESNINYSWQGQTRLDYVERLMSPNYNGTVLNFASSDTQVVNLNFTRNGGWVFHNLEIAAFIQNLEDKEILQGTKSPLDSLTTGINDELVILPTQTQLLNNYPNPFNPSTKIAFTLKNAGPVHLDIYNMLGQKVRTLVNARFDAGEHFAIWDGRDDAGSQSASGTYFVKMTADNFNSTKKMVLLK